MYVILVYDISLENNGAKTLRNVFKLCKKYLHHVQCSVFEGELSNVQLTQLKSDLKHWIRPDLDSIILFHSRQKKWLDKELLGKQDAMIDNFL